MCHLQLATNPSLYWQHKWCSYPNFASLLQKQTIPTASMSLAELKLWEFYLPFSPTICFTWSVTIDWNPNTTLRAQCSLCLGRSHHLTYWKITPLYPTDIKQKSFETIPILAAPRWAYLKLPGTYRCSIHGPFCIVARSAAFASIPRCRGYVSKRFIST